MDELSPQAEAKDLELAATRGFVPGERLSKILFDSLKRSVCHAADGAFFG